MILAKKHVLHVGCGGYAPEKLHAVFSNDDWHEVRLDIDDAVRPDIVASMTDMAAVADGSVDAVFSSHNLEHLYPHDVPAALKEFRRVLTPGGFALITLPDLQEVARLVATGQLAEPAYMSALGPIAPLDILYGHRRDLAAGNLFMAHHTGFTGPMLMAALTDAGFAAVAVQRVPSSFSLWAIGFATMPTEQRLHEAQYQMLPLHAALLGQAGTTAGDPCGRLRQPAGPPRSRRNEATPSPASLITMQTSSGPAPPDASPDTSLVAAVAAALADAVLCVAVDAAAPFYAVPGMSGRRYRRFINQLVGSLADPAYLEVGSWAGSTLCSAICGNALRAVAIDNWSEFGGPKDAFTRNVQSCVGPGAQVFFIEGDFRAVNYAGLGKFNIYFFDGPHEQRDQYDGIALALPALASEFVFIVDDWNWQRVRAGTFAAIRDTGLSVIYAAEIRSTLNETHPEKAFGESDWHNGYYIAVLRKPIDPRVETPSIGAAAVAP